MAEVRTERLAGAIERFYEAATQPALWRCALDEMGEAFGADGVILVPGPGSGVAPACSESFAEVVDHGVRHGFFDTNPRMIRGVPALKTPFDVLTQSDIFTPDELDRHPWNAEFTNRLGFRWFAGTALVRAGPASVGISVERRARHDPFAPREIELLRGALPHLQRAAQLASALAQARFDGMEDAFEQMRCGCILFDRSGVALRLSGRARAHMGRGIDVRSGHVVAADRGSDDLLQKLLASLLRKGPASEAPARGVVALRRRERRPLLARGAPIVRSGRDLFQRVRAVLVLIDPEESGGPDDRVLRQAYDLTPAEARLAAALADGKDLKEIAAAFGISEATIRSQLKAVLQKTSTHRQAELVSVLRRLAVPAPP